MLTGSLEANSQHAAGPAPVSKGPQSQLGTVCGITAFMVLSLIILRLQALCSGVRKQASFGEWWRAGRIGERVESSTVSYTEHGQAGTQTGGRSSIELKHPE